MCAQQGEAREEATEQTPCLRKASFLGSGSRNRGAGLSLQLAGSPARGTQRGQAPSPGAAVPGCCTVLGGRVPPRRVPGSAEGHCGVLGRVPLPVPSSSGPCRGRGAPPPGSARLPPARQLLPPVPVPGLRACTGRARARQFGSSKKRGSNYPLKRALEDFQGFITRKPPGARTFATLATRCSPRARGLRGGFGALWAQHWGDWGGTGAGRGPWQLLAHPQHRSALLRRGGPTSPWLQPIGSGKQPRAQRGGGGTRNHPK